MSTRRRWIILGAVGGAVALTLVVKFSAAPPEGESVVTAQSVVAESPVEASVRVTLVADPREAESSCGCGEIIRAAREAGQIDGVQFREIDPRTVAAQMAELGARVSPTVLIWSADGGEPQRFEGESPEVVEGVRQAVAQLSQAEPR